MPIIERGANLRIKACWFVIFATAVGTAITLAALAERMAPIQPGDSDKFWLTACNIHLDGKGGYIFAGDAYIIDDSTVAYDYGGMHGTQLYQLPLADVMRDFDAVLDKLEAKHQRGEEHYVTLGYIAWRDDPNSQKSAQGLLESIERARHEAAKEHGYDRVAYIFANEQRFWERWRRADWYWANFVFEWVLVTGLVLFAVWPVMRMLPAWRWGLYFGLLPLLFMLPVYLGYCINAFSSSSPNGGVLYPELLWLTRGGSLTELDVWLLRRIPQILEPISASVGTPIVSTGFGMPGPTSVVVTGAIVGGLSVAIRLAMSQWNAPPSNSNA